MRTFYRTETARPTFGWVLVLGSLISVYLLINLALPHLFTGFSRTTWSSQSCGAC